MDRNTLPEAITVVPSHNLTVIFAAPAVSVTKIDPEANHVPDDPCATLGPSKKVAVLFSRTSALVDLVIGDRFACELGAERTPAATVTVVPSALTAPNCEVEP